MLTNQILVTFEAETDAGVFYQKYIVGLQIF